LKKSPETPRANIMFLNTQIQGRKSLILHDPEDSTNQVFLSWFRHWCSWSRGIPTSERPIERRQIRPLQECECRQENVYGWTQAILYWPGCQAIDKYWVGYSAPGPGSYRAPSDFGYYDNIKGR
jgi:hypothetical protein